MVSGAGLVRRPPARVPLSGSAGPDRQYVGHGLVERRADTNPISTGDGIREDDAGLTRRAVNHPQRTPTSLGVDRRGLEGVPVVVQQDDLDLHAGQQIDRVPVDVRPTNEAVHRRAAGGPRGAPGVVRLPCVFTAAWVRRGSRPCREDLRRHQHAETHPYEDNVQARAPTARAPAPRSYSCHRALLSQPVRSPATLGPTRRTSDHVARACGCSVSGRPGMRNETPTSTCLMMRAWDRSETFSARSSSRTMPPDIAGRATWSPSTATSRWRISSSI